MKKMPCLFQRDFTDPRRPGLLPAVTPGCEWAFTREAKATVKYDGTACMVRNGRLYKRLDCKRDRKTGVYKAPPDGSIPCDMPDEVTGHWPHWVPVGGGPEDKWHRVAWDHFIYGHLAGAAMPDGTYELCGPHFNGNPQKFDYDRFVPHGADVIEWEYLDELPGEHQAFTHPFATTVDRMRILAGFLTGLEVEGIVFHHPDGRMCKIRRADFGLTWGSKGAR